MPDPKCKIFQSTYLGDEKDNDWTNMWRTIEAGKQPFKYIDRLQIAFANIMADDPDKSYLQYSYPDRAQQTIKAAKTQNPNIEIIAQMGWASGLLPLFSDRSKTRERLDTFASSITEFIKEYDLHGIDFDWEFGGAVASNVTTDDATFLFERTRYYLDKANRPVMTITPDGETPQGQYLDVAVLNKLFNTVIPQSYGRVKYIDNYINAGILPSKLCCGICSERDGQWWPNGVVSADIKQYTDKVDQYKLSGLYSWRVDNDDADADTNLLKYTITTSMWTYSRGVAPQPPLYP